MKNTFKSGAFLRTAGIFVLMFCSGLARARIAVVVLPFYSLSESTNFSHWAYTLPFLLKMQLAEIPEVRVLPDDSIDFGADQSLQFAYREAGPPGRSSQDFTSKLGRILEADLVIAGTYESKGSNWTVRARGLDVHTGKYSWTVSCDSSNIFIALCEVRKRLLKDLRIRPASLEARLDHPLTDSFPALDLMGSALAGWGGALADKEQKLRRALMIDPAFTVARAMLAATLALEGQLQGAVQEAKKAVSEQPSLASAHYILGNVYLMQEDNNPNPELERMAERELWKARQLAPDDPEVLLTLAKVAEFQDNSREAISLLRKVKELAFYNPRIHEAMAQAYIELANPAKALDELRTAERFDFGEYQSTVALAQLCDALRLTQKAVHYYERGMALAERAGIRGGGLAEMKERVRGLETRLTPHFVTASPPESFTPAGLESAIREKLGKVDTELPKSPFEQTLEMGEWAHRIVGTNADEMTKAKLLFEAMTRRFVGSQWRGQRNAEEVFNEWTNEQAKLSCEDYTFLYVCLARDVGLSAFFVQVTKNDSGDPVLHTCPGVFLGGKAVLVDPVADWFGAPHQEYAFLNDLQATALFWSQSEDLKINGYAAKLAPQLPFVHFNLALALAASGQTNRAREELQAGLALPEKLWLAPAIEGRLELAEGNALGAMKQFQKCSALHPDFPTLHYLMAQAYEATDDLKGARQELQAFVERGEDPRMVAAAWQQISELDARLEFSQSRTSQPSGASRSAPVANPVDRGKETVPSS